MLVRARHKVFGVCEVPQRTVERWPDDWQLVEETTPTGAEERAATAAAADPYDPAEHTLAGDDGVLAYLAAATPEERERVIAAERARGDAARKTVLEWEPPTE